MSGKELIVVITSCNVKKIDQKAYGIKKQLCQVKVKVGEKEVQSTVKPGLDPEWEEEFKFDIADENETKVFASFYMDEDNKRIGDEQQFLLSALTNGKPIYKALVVPGGVVNMMMTAKGFGKEGEEEDTTGFMDMMDGGGMDMD